MTKNYIQAVNAYKRQAIDTHLKHDDETLEEYIDRIYALGVWRLIMVSGITDWAVYRADDLLREQRPDLEQDRAAMMRHYTFYEDRLHMLTNAPDDYLDDIRLKALQRHRRKVDALSNAVRKEYTHLGVPFAEVCTTLCLFTNFIVVAEKTYRAYVELLGEAIIKQLPTYPEDAIRRLERSGNAANRLIEAIDTQGLAAGRVGTKVTERIVQGLLDSIISAEELDRAAAYANKEYRKAEREAAKKK